jgi:hypothetical protein
MKALLKLLGYEVRQPSLLLMHMVDVTHESWMGTLKRKNQLDKYLVKKY